MRKPNADALHACPWVPCLVKRGGAAHLDLHGQPGRLQRLKRQVQPELRKEVRHLAAQRVRPLQHLIWRPVPQAAEGVKSAYCQQTSPSRLWGCDAALDLKAYSNSTLAVCKDMPVNAYEFTGNAASERADGAGTPSEQMSLVEWNPAKHDTLVMPRYYP